MSPRDFVWAFSFVGLVPCSKSRPYVLGVCFCCAFYFSLCITITVIILLMT